MSSPADATSKAADRRTQLRQAAIILVPTLWVTMTGMRVCFGEPFPQAGLAVGVLTLGALVAWWAYHALSGRNDGLFLFVPIACAQTAVGRELTVTRELLRCVVVVITMIAFSAVLGLTWRDRASKPGPNRPGLWGDDMDRSPGR